MNTMAEIFARTVGSFIVLFLLTRFLGRKQISQLTFFNYVTGISIGAVAGSLSVDPSIKLSSGIVCLVTWTALTILLAFIDISSRKGKKIIDGEPIIVVKRGTVMIEALKKMRLGMDELNQMLRGKDVFSVTDVEFAILETNGELSVMLKEGKQPVTKEDKSLNN